MSDFTFSFFPSHFLGIDRILIQLIDWPCTDHQARLKSAGRRYGSCVRPLSVDTSATSPASSATRSRLPPCPKMTSWSVRWKVILRCFSSRSAKLRIDLDLTIIIIFPHLCNIVSGSNILRLKSRVFFLQKSESIPETRSRSFLNSHHCPCESRRICRIGTSCCCGASWRCRTPREWGWSRATAAGWSSSGRPSSRTDI